MIKQVERSLLFFLSRPTIPDKDQRIRRSQMERGVPPQISKLIFSQSRQSVLPMAKLRPR
uniref:Uncharacterized protein n=1 Tax=Medicago truncatula TaxID=3880 RepID=Q2HSE3_MEDTR|nr:hypothetical protein MtrDRAFT_AC151523g34v2 [Medicago truncatula]